MPGDGSPTCGTENEGETEPGLFRKLTDRFRRNGATVRQHVDVVPQERRAATFYGLWRIGRPNNTDGNSPDARQAANGGDTSPARLKRIFSLGSRSGMHGRLFSHKEQRSGSPEAFTTLNALERNLDALREVVTSKQNEVDRLREQLQNTTMQSNAFEQRLRKEQHRRVIVTRQQSSVGMYFAAKGEEKEDAPVDGDTAVIEN